MTTEIKVLFTTEYGQVFCVDHLGYYDSRKKVTQRERKEWLDEVGYPMDCETCSHPTH